MKKLLHSNGIIMHLLAIKIDKKLKKYFVTDDSPSGIKLKNLTDSYRTAVEKWRSKISDKTRRTILGYFFGREKEQIMDHWIIIS